MRTIIVSRIAIAVVLLATAFSGCSRSVPQTEMGHPIKADENAAWPVARLNNIVLYDLDGRFSIDITGPTSFVCNGVECRLLGVKPKSDRESINRAMVHFRQLIDEARGRILFLNDDNPLMNGEDCIVWIRQEANLAKEINIELLRQRLVDIDLISNADYSFTVLSKDGEKIIDWKQLLKNVITAN